MNNNHVGSFRVEQGDCRTLLARLADDSVDAIVTDPPYELGFMGKAWDSTGIAYQVDVWRECQRVLKPGGHLLAFGGSRTYHRLACAIEDAGFQIRDQIMWVYGSGFPKSLDVSKAIDKAAGVERQNGKLKWKGGTQLGVINDDSWKPKDVYESEPCTADAKQWQGWGTALKPAHEPIVLARKPLDGTVANNVLTHGVGALNIDGCRVDMGDEYDPTKMQRQQHSAGAIDGAFGASALIGKEIPTYKPGGRFPANFIHDGSDEVLELFPDSKGGAYPAKRGQAVATSFASGQETEGGYRAMGDNGSAARFFYSAKANKKERNAGLGAEGATSQVNHHPTVKPIALMRYLARLITPPLGIVLDPFTGSGSTGVACVLEGFDFLGFEESAEYVEIAVARINYATSGGDGRKVRRDQTQNGIIQEVSLGGATATPVRPRGDSSGDC